MTPPDQDAALASEADKIASFLSPFAAGLLSHIVAGHKLREYEEGTGVPLNSFLRELYALRLIQDKVPTPLGRLVAPRTPPIPESITEPAPFVVKVSISLGTVVEILWCVLPPDDHHIPWCSIERWELPAGVDRLCLPGHYAVLSPEVAEIRAAYPLDAGEYIHEACAAPVLGGYVDLRITAGELEGQVVRLNREALDRGFALLFARSDSAEEFIMENGLFTFPEGDEFLQYCLFGKILFPPNSTPENRR